MTLTPGRVALLAAVAALAFGAWRIAARPAEQARDGAANAGAALVTQADTARFTVARANLELQRRTQGTYAGAAMPPGMTLVRADVAGYCVQLADGGPVSHVAGLTAPVQPGPC